MELELGLGLAPPANSGHLSGAAVSSPAARGGGGKRGFGEAFEAEEEEEQRTAEAATTTLPLFDDGSSSTSESSGSENKKALVGWPPVSWARSRACGGSGRGRHVKVRKEGAAIGRKVDLSLHGSYSDLLATLARMFPEPTTTVDGDSSHHGGLVVTYEDADGDWMLVGDVPWEDFARSVKRLKILL